MWFWKSRLKFHLRFGRLDPIHREGTRMRKGDLEKKLKVDGWEKIPGMRTLRKFTLQRLLGNSNTGSKFSHNKKSNRSSCRIGLLHRSGIFHPSRKSSAPKVRPIVAQGSALGS
jgi:hypothetical protein